MRFGSSRSNVSSGPIEEGKKWFGRARYGEWRGKAFSKKTLPLTARGGPIESADCIINVNLLEFWQRPAKIETFILGFSYNSFQNVVQAFSSFSNWLRRLNLTLSNSVVAYKWDIFRIMASAISREPLGVRNAFSYVNINRLEGSNPKAIMKFLTQACDYK